MVQYVLNKRFGWFFYIALQKGAIWRTNTKERIREVFVITRKAESAEKKLIQMIESVVYTMADKFLDKDEMKEIMEEISMTTLGQMLVEKGFNDGFSSGIKSTREVCKSIDFSEEKALEILMDKFALTRDTAAEYMEMYWNIKNPPQK